MYVKSNVCQNLLKGTLRFRFTALRSPSYNKGYTVRGSARPSPKFFFHFVPEKLRISLTLSEIIKKLFFLKILTMEIGGYDKVYKENSEIQKEVAGSIIESVLFFRQNKIKKILDLGCGTGRNTSYLKNGGFDVLGCDVSSEALNIAKKNVAGVFFEQCPMSSLSFPDDLFDGVVCNHVLQHGMINDIKKAVDEIYRVLRPNGVILLEVASTESSKYLKGTEVETNTRINVGGSDGHVPHHFFTKEEIQEFFKFFEILQLSHSIHPSELNPEIMSATWKMYAKKQYGKNF